MIPLALPGGAEAVVRVRRSRRARRLLLHVNIAGEVELVLPARTSMAEGISFANHKAGWVARCLRGIPDPVPFADGNDFPLLGETLRIRHVEQLFEDLWRRKRDVFVAAPAGRVPGLVERWLREVALREISQRSRATASRLDRPVGRIAVSDTRSQWGSCSHSGNLNFSWRLVLAPERVLDYVVAHEVAHLVELNHTRRFWSLVETLAVDVAGCRAWLRRHGAELHRYGAAARS